MIGIATAAPATSNPRQPRTRHYCYIKPSWDDGWEHLPYLDCLRVSQVAAPEVSSANFIYRFGEIKREDKTSFASYTPGQLRNWFVRVDTVLDGAGGATRQFVGIMADEQYVLSRVDPPSGDYTGTAFGVEHIFDRQPIKTAVIEEKVWADPEDVDSEVTRTIKIVNNPLPFNMRGQWGAALFGNRTEKVARDTAADGAPPADAPEFDGGGEQGENPESTPDEELTWAFSEEAKKWSSHNAMDYLLYYSPWMQEDIFDIQLAGQVQALDTIFAVWDQDNVTYWNMFNRLIDRRYGVGFRVFVDENDSIVFDTFSLTDIPLIVGEATLIPNDRQMAFAMPTDFPQDHLVDQIPYRITSLNSFERIIARGARIKVCGTFIFGSDEDPFVSQLRRGWTVFKEVEYLEALPNPTNTPADIPLADAVREKMKHVGVFQKLRVNKAWDWTSATIGDNQPIAPKCKKTGVVEFAKENAETNSIYGLEFMRDLPFEKGKDYSKSPIMDSNPAGIQPEYETAFGCIRDSIIPAGAKTPENHVPNGSLVRMDSIHNIYKGAQSVRIKMCDKELAFIMEGPYGHYMALSHMYVQWKLGPPVVDEAASNAHATLHNPEFNYENAKLTAMFETHEHLFVENETGLGKQTNDPLEKILVIECLDCEYWYAPPGTLINIDSSKNGDAGIITIHADNCKIRNDVDKLESVMAVALAWYGVERQAVQIPIKQVGVFASIGDLITQIEFVPGSELFYASVRTVVTGRTIDLQAGTTVLETGYVALDAKTVVDARNPTKKFAGRGGVAARGLGGRK